MGRKKGNINHLFEPCGYCGIFFLRFTFSVDEVASKKGNYNLNQSQMVITEE